MAGHDEQIAERLAALEAQADAKALEAAESMRLYMAPPKPTLGASLRQEAEHRQERALYERRRLHEEWARAYEEQLARVAPKVERLEVRLRELRARREETQRRHAAEIAKVDADLSGVSREINECTTPPPMPAEPVSPDAVEVVVGWASGHVQLIPKDVIDAQMQRRRPQRDRKR